MLIVSMLQSVCFAIICCSIISVGASFTTKAVGQSNPLAGGANIITVTVVTNANLSATDS